MAVEDIVRKIAALRRLANKAGTPEEAAAAAAKAQELLFAHNIDEAMLAMDAPDDLGAYIDHEGIVVKDSWRQEILRGLTTANFVKRLRQKRDGKPAFRLIGRRANIEAVLDLYDWLQREVNRLSGANYRDYVATCEMHGEAPETASNWGHAFRCGAAKTVAERLRDQRRADEARISGAQCTALAVVDGQLNEAFRRFHPSTVHVPARGAVRGSGFAAGRMAGHSVGLSRPANIGGGRRAARIA